MGDGGGADWLWPKYIILTIFVFLPALCGAIFLAAYVEEKFGWNPKYVVVPFIAISIWAYVSPLIPGVPTLIDVVYYIIENTLYR